MKIANKKNLLILVAIILVFSIGNIAAQLVGSNLLEYQLGNQPDQEPKNMTTLYDQLNLSYRYNFIRLNTKIEWFQSADHEKEYVDFVQKSIQFEKNDFGLTIGNFYYMIGSGLLLRSYEITGAILEDNTFRTRYGFYRDIEGFKGRYENDWLQATAFRGRPLNNLLPPTQSDEYRRPHLLEGVEAKFNIADWSFGGSYLRDNYQGEVREMASAEMGANLPFNIQLFSEYAQDFAGDSKILDISKNTAHAFYAGLNYYLGGFGASVEYKNYNDFDLGYNDPPPLVKEHQYILLNRATHAVETMNETGWQIEAFYTFNGGHSITLNRAEATNNIFDNQYQFSEYFAEVRFQIDDVTDLKGFIDYNKEELFDIDNRFTGGAYLETEWLDRWGVILNFEYQNFDRVLSATQKIENMAAFITVTKSPSLSINVTAERSNDPYEITEKERYGYWLAANCSYQYNQNHLLSLFYGKRRGGRACTSGICYEILPFEGFELRLTSNL